MGQSQNRPAENPFDNQENERRRKEVEKLQHAREQRPRTDKQEQRQKQSRGTDETTSKPSGGR